MADSSSRSLNKEFESLAALQTAIGRFIIEFSQLEFVIRHVLGDALDLRETGDDANFDIVTAPYDFATLCNVTTAIFTRTMGANADDCRSFNVIMKECLDLNREHRVPIVHGSWFLDENGPRGTHVSRTSLQATIKYSQIDQIEAAATRAGRLREKLIAWILAPLI